MRVAKGFTLIELIGVLSLLALLGALVAPSFATQLAEHKRQGSRQQLQWQLNRARHLAMLLGQPITLCGSSDQQHCDGEWANSVIAFADTNDDRQTNINEPPLFVETLSDPTLNIQWRNFGNQRTLQFRPSGTTDYQNGTFSLCPNNQKVNQAVGISVAITGRIQATQDRNGDGIEENTSGTPLRCTP